MKKSPYKHPFETLAYNKGYQQATANFIKKIDNEIKSIIKLKKDKSVIVNHNFWKAHINQLEELKKSLEKNNDKL